MCRDELCVPLGEEARRDGKVDIAAFWVPSGIPSCPIRRRSLGVRHRRRQPTAALTGLEAPDFALPDLSGVQHRLSDLRGQKVFLTTWASW